MPFPNSRPCAFPELTADGFTGQKRVLADTRPTLGEAECEEDPCSLRMHTTFGFQRGMMGSCCTGEAMIRQEVVLQLVDHYMITSLGTDRGDRRDGSV